MFLPYINADISIPDDMHTALIGLQVAAMAKGLRVVDKGFVIDYLVKETDVDPGLFKEEFLYPA